MVDPLFDPWASPDPPTPTVRWTRVWAALAVGVLGPLLGAFAGGGPTSALVPVVACVVWVAALTFALPGRRAAPFVVLIVPPAVAAVAATSVGLERSELILPLWSAALADWALSGWWPARPAGASTRFPVAVAPLVLAGLAHGSTRLSTPPWAWVLLSFLALLGAAAVPDLAARLDHAVGAALSRASGWIATLVTLGLALPFVYLPGLVVRRRRGPAATYWSTVDVSADEVERDAARMFASTPRGARRRRLVGTAAALGVGLIVVLLAADGQRPAPRSSTFAAADDGAAASAAPAPGQGITYSQTRAMRDVPFADPLQSEQNEFLEWHLVPDPDTAYVSGDFAGSMTNTSGGERRTLEPTPCDCAEATVWLLGGSAAFGIGQRDEHTIASELVRAGRRDGLALTVRNLAVPGWVLPQEVAAVDARLRAGEPPPDLVVFYDGYNDAFLATALSASLGAVPDRLGRMDDQAYLDFQSLVRQGNGSLAGAIERAGGAAAIGSLAADHIRGVSAAASERLGATGVSTAFFLQTDAMVTPDGQLDAGRFEPGLAAEPDRRAWADVLDSLERGLRRSDVVDLRQVATQADGPVFIDSVHTNETGARLVAAALYEHVRSQLISRADPPPS